MYQKHLQVRADLFVTASLILPFSKAFTSPVNPNWVGAHPKWGLIGINSLRLAVSFSWIGKANRLVSFSGTLLIRIMKLKSSGAGIFRENEMIFSSEGIFGVKSVRPKQPATVQERCKWIIGDVTEVFDRNTWKLGKILEMSNNNYFVIRLADCIQLKEFHISSLRIPNASGAHHSKELPTSDKATRAAQQRNGKKRKAAADAPHHLSKSKRAHLRNVAPASNLNGAMADSYLHSPSQVSRDEAECSVASCSVNDPDHLYGNARGKRRAAAAALPDDAMSSCPCTSGTEEEEDDGLVDVHALELEAYRSTMRALYASGPLTWEQESLLTNLRMSLNISNEEHLRQLRRLLSSS